MLQQPNTTDSAESFTESLPAPPIQLDHEAEHETALSVAQTMDAGGILAATVELVPKGFDYELISNDKDRETARRAALEVKSSSKRAWSEMIKTGRKLAEAKKCLSHGLWESWVKDEFGWSTRSARRLMSYGRYLWNLKSAAAADLPTDYLDDLARLDNGLREQAIRRLNAGDVPGHDELKAKLPAVVKKPKAAAAPPVAVVSSTVASTPPSSKPKSVKPACSEASVDVQATGTATQVKGAKEADALDASVINVQTDVANTGITTEDKSDVPAMDKRAKMFAALTGALEFLFDKDKPAEAVSVFCSALSQEEQDECMTIVTQLVYGIDDWQRDNKAELGVTA